MFLSPFLLSSLLPSSAFYLPGVTPKQYLEGEVIDLKVNELTSSKTQLPYSYYSLPVCKPPEGVKESTENLGELLHGDLVQNSPFTLRMLKQETCQFLCTIPLTEGDKSKMRSMIDDQYTVNWIVDSLPAAVRIHGASSKTDEFGNKKDVVITSGGFPLGVRAKINDLPRYYLHNHFTLRLFYHTEPTFEGYRIVGFEIEPRSISQMTRQEEPSETAEGEVKDARRLGEVHVSADCWSDYVRSKPFNLDSAVNEITYTYDVEFVYSEVKWASRWDVYLQGSQSSAMGQVHWFSIVNNILIALFLTGMVAMILLRTLLRDISRYNDMGAQIVGEMSVEEAAEESGWKLVHGDVFRPPTWRKFLSAATGTGCQLICMSYIVIVFAAMGFFSPVNRGAILQGAIMVYMLMGIVAGYVSARVYKSLDDIGNWKQVTVFTAMLFPGLSFGMFFTLNLFIWGTGSSGAVPFPAMFIVLVFWLCVSTPLVFVGAHFGYKQDPFSFPCRVHSIPRAIPSQPWFLHPGFLCLVGGVLPFGAVFTELFFIMSSIWQHQFYYLFGFMIAVVCILLITCAEVSIALTYFQLTSEDYRWWWRSFFTSASSGLYVFGYSILYFYTRLQMSKFVSVVVYFGYMLLVSVAFSLFTGTIGFFATLKFVQKIYGSVKVD